MIVFKKDRTVWLDTASGNDDPDMWAAIYKAAVHTGYRMRSVEDTRDVYMHLAEGTKTGSYRFNNDMARALRRIYGYEKEKGDALVQEAADAAERYFGVTYNMSLAGYLDTNGRFLCLSGDGLTRDRDHREINAVLETLGIDCGGGYSDGLIAFMDMGNIRLGIRGVDISVLPNERQWPKLMRYLARAGHTVYVDLSAKESGARIATLEFSGMDKELVRGCLEEFFNTGNIPGYAAVI